MEQASLTDGVEIAHQCDDKRDQTLVLLDSVSFDTEKNRSHVEEQDEVLLPQSPSDAVIDSDLTAAVASNCAPASMSHCSPDSGVYSKAASNSVTTSQSTTSKSVEITADFSQLSAESKADAKTVDTNDDETKTDSLLPQMSFNTCSLVKQTTNLVDDDDDDDDQNTKVDVRSSVMSAGTDDTINQAVIETEKEMFDEGTQTVVVPVLTGKDASCEDMNNIYLPPDKHMSCLGSEDKSTVSDSDAEDDAILKTVVAVRTKAVSHTECADSVKLFQPDDVAYIAELQNDGKACVDASMGKFCDEFTGECISHGDAGIDSSETECSKLNRDAVETTLHAETNGTDVESNSVPVDIMENKNTEKGTAVETSPGRSELLSTMSTELDQYMAEHSRQVTDVSSDSQTLDAAAVDSCQLLDLMASVKIFSEDESLRVESTGRRSHPRTGSFTSNSNHSFPLSRSNSIEVTGTEKIRRRSSTLSSLQPEDVVKDVNDMSLGWQVHESSLGTRNTMDADISLTASMEDLRLRPSKKRLEFDSLPAAATSHSVFLDPPDEYRDHRMSAENGKSFMSPTGIDLVTDDAHRPAVDLNMQAKEDHLKRYLKSLASLPACESAHEGLNGCRLQDSQANSQDVSNSFSFDGENVAEIPRHECSTSVLIPHLLHQSDNVAELLEDDYLEAQLQQYEVMKRRLMEEHRRSLEHLLAEQEQQMSLLQSRLMGQTLVNGSSTDTGFVAHKPSTVVKAGGDFDSCCGKLLPSDVSDTFNNSLNLISEVPVPSHSGLGQDRQDISSTDPHVNLSVGEISGSHKMRSPAGVFYNDRQAISREPSCSTIRSGDTESEFAYKSPAVLRSSRRVTPTRSPRDNSGTQQDLMHHSLLSTRDSYLHSSTGPDYPAVHSHKLNRRYVDMFTAASITL